jgi:outer membrane receptor for ferrienterochelin and colicins
VYSPAENTAIKLLYGRAFRAPNAYELYYYQSATSGLQPETIETTDLAFERYLSRHTWMRTSGFYNEISNLIGQTTNPLTDSIEFINLDGARVKGLEAELNERGPSGWEGRVSYTIQDARDAHSGGVLSNSPKQLAKLNVIAPLVKNGLFGSFEGQCTSRRRTVFGTDTGGFFIANLTLYSQEFVKRLQLSASVYNLFGKRYADPGAEEHLQPAITQDGRNFRIKLVYRF